MQDFEKRKCIDIRCARPKFLLFVYDALRDLYKGLSFVRKEKKVASIFGSARDVLPSHYYELAEDVAGFFVRNGYSVLTGGGGGIMRSSNMGAHRAGGRSLGVTISLPYEKVKNAFLTDYVNSSYFFTRKAALYYSAHIFIFLPGGLGTIDELSEVLVMKQTKKIPNMPVILVGREFWKPFDAFVSHHMIDTYKTVSEEDKDLYVIVDTVDELEVMLKEQKFFDMRQ